VPPSRNARIAVGNFQITNRLVSRITGSGATSNARVYPVKDGFYFQTEQVTNLKLWRFRSLSFVYLQNCKKFSNHVLEVKCVFKLL
jgi:hypothetical protein